MPAVRAAIATCLLLAGLIAPAAQADPIPDDPLQSAGPEFSGSAAQPRRLSSPDPPRHPFMAPNGRSNLHDDAYQTDTYLIPGPIGQGMSRTSTLQAGVCASVTFDARGRIVTVCVGLQGPRLLVLDPTTLDTLAEFGLPPRIPSSVSIFNDFAGGGYFYLDHLDRAVIPTTTRHVYVVAIGDPPAPRLVADHDLTGVVPAGDRIISALPDWSGRIWFASTNGVVGNVDPATGAIRSYDTREPIANSFAVDESGAVYVVTQRALYRFDAGPDGTPTVSWREEYANSGIAKPGQVHAGSGTTPTVMGRRYVAITDNADPMNVVVYQRAPQADGERKVCAQPVFERGASATDQSLIVVGRSIVAENNYGYTGPTATMDGNTTSPGIERVDLDRDGRGCTSIWRSPEIAPSVVPKVSLETGLLYTYTKPPRDDDADAWYFTALDFCTGRTAYRRLAGMGFGFNNNFAPVTLGPDGSAYVGVIGGLVRLADATPPVGPPPTARRGCSTRPRVSLRLRFRGGRTRAGRRCAESPVRAWLRGIDVLLVDRVAFYRGRRRVASDARRPFSKLVDRPMEPGLRRIRARVRMRDGALFRLKRAYRACPQA
jgi:hypothetical protein